MTSEVRGQHAALSLYIYMYKNDYMQSVLFKPPELKLQISVYQNGIQISVLAEALHSLLSKALRSYRAQGRGESSGYWMLDPRHLSQGHPFPKFMVPSGGASLLLGDKHLYLWRDQEPCYLGPCLSKCSMLPLKSLPSLGCYKVVGQRLVLAGLSDSLPSPVHPGVVTAFPVPSPLSPSSLAQSFQRFPFT